MRHEGSADGASRLWQGQGPLRAISIGKTDLAWSCSISGSPKADEHLHDAGDLVLRGERVLEGDVAENTKDVDGGGALGG